jgi:hypothetical protein
MHSALKADVYFLQVSAEPLIIGLFGILTASYGLPLPGFTQLYHSTVVFMPNRF